MTTDRASIAVAHIGIAVEDLEPAARAFAKIFGITPSPVEEVPTEGVRLCFFELANCRIELLEGTHPDSPISKFLARGGRGVHHIAFSDDATDIRKLLHEFKGDGVAVIDEKVRLAAENKEAFFVHPRDSQGVLVEFVGERRRSESAPDDQNA